MRGKTIIAAVVGLLALPALAEAHVTVQPSEVPAGGFTRLDVRVPNERDNAETEKVQVQMPDGFIFASYEPVPGWSTDVKMEKTDQPIESHGEEFDEQVKTITWTADQGGSIGAGEFQDFGLSVGMPEEAQAGDTLTFPALQTYDDGQVVRWIGPPDSEEPASEVTVTPAEEEHGAAAGEEEAGELEPASTVEPGADDDGGEDSSMTLAIIALIVGGVGLLAGAVGLLAARRRSA